MIVDHVCCECGFEGEVIEHSRKVKCPDCMTVNDIWLTIEEPPPKHREV